MPFSIKDLLCGALKQNLKIHQDKVLLCAARWKRQDPELIYSCVFINDGFSSPKDLRVKKDRDVLSFRFSPSFHFLALCKQDKHKLGVHEKLETQRETVWETGRIRTVFKSVYAYVNEFFIRCAFCLYVQYGTCHVDDSQKGCNVSCA